MAHPYADKMQGGSRAKAMCRQSGGQVPTTKGGTPQQTVEPLKVDPKGALGSALLKAKPRGAYPGVRWADEKKD